MDKRVVFAVAGSGKTSSIIDKIEEDSRCLIVTYTDNNTRNLKNRIIRKLGKIPESVRIYSYFTFLYSFCYRPLCGYELKTKGINFNYPLPKYAQRTKKNAWEHYIDKSNRLFSSRVSKLLMEFNVTKEVIERIEGFFDLVCIDEVQDFAANDFNFLCELSKTNSELILVGDFYQHTFDTSRDGNTQKGLHDCFIKYCKKLENAGYSIDSKSLSNSYRCSPSVCDFVESNLKIKIKSHRDDKVKVTLLENINEIEQIFSDHSIVKLFYQKSNAYNGNTENWGNTKGLDHFQDVCVVLNPTTYKAFVSGKLAQLAPITKNKLYVACTRARGNLYFISESMLKKHKIK
jgi:DNA helicase II / ATP-dependent DNA helicase PcrA